MNIAPSIGVIALTRPASVVKEESITPQGLMTSSPGEDKIPRIVSDQFQAMCHRGSRQQTIDSWQGSIRLSEQAPPAISHAQVNRDDAASKKTRQFDFQPIQQFQLALAGGQHVNAFADLAHSQDAQKQGCGWSLCEPVDHACIRRTAAQFRQEIGIDQIAHRSTSRVRL